MKKYTVNVFTTHIHHHEIEVEAKNEEEAKDIAFQNLDNNTIINDELKDTVFGDVIELPKK